MLSLTKIAFATLGLLVLTGANFASATPKSATTSYECVTDDGFGRKRPCSAGFQQKRAETPATDCFTDDGYGRKRPCSAGVKP